MRNLPYYAMANLWSMENQIRLEELRIGPLTLDKYVPTGNKHYKFDIYTPQPKSAENYGESWHQATPVILVSEEIMESDWVF